jgi:hypothetical protein
LIELPPFGRALVITALCTCTRAHAHTLSYIHTLSLTLTRYCTHASASVSVSTSTSSSRHLLSTQPKPRPRSHPRQPGQLIIVNRQHSAVTRPSLRSVTAVSTVPGSPAPSCKTLQSHRNSTNSFISSASQKTCNLQPATYGIRNTAKQLQLPGDRRTRGAPPKSRRRHAARSVALVPTRQDPPSRDQGYTGGCLIIPSSLQAIPDSSLSGTVDIGFPSNFHPAPWFCTWFLWISLRVTCHEKEPPHIPPPPSPLQNRHPGIALIQPLAYGLPPHLLPWATRAVTTRAIPGPSSPDHRRTQVVHVGTWVVLRTCTRRYTCCTTTRRLARLRLAAC